MWLKVWQVVKRAAPVVLQLWAERQAKKQPLTLGLGDDAR